LFLLSSLGLERIIVGRQFSFAVRSTKGAQSTAIPLKTIDIKIAEYH
jgi:hypothetical protein